MIDFFLTILVHVRDFLLYLAPFYISAGIYYWWMIRFPMKYLHFLDKVLPLLYLGGSVWMWYGLWQLADGEFFSLWGVFRQKLFDVTDDVHDYLQHLFHIRYAIGSIWLHTREVIITIATTHLLFFPLFYLWELRSKPRNFWNIITSPLQVWGWFDITLILYLCIRLNNTEVFNLKVTIIFLIMCVQAWFQEPKQLK